MQENKPMAGFGVGPDWETFQRVWKRVMPNEENSPVQVRTQPEERMPPPMQPLPEQSEPEKRLEEMMGWLWAGVRRAGRMTGQPGGLSIWNMLYQQRRQALRQFGTMYFLQVGKRYSGKGKIQESGMDLDQMLRQEYLWENRWQELCHGYDRKPGKRELERLCAEELERSRQRAEKIRQTLERME